MPEKCSLFIRNLLTVTDMRSYRSLGARLSIDFARISRLASGDIQWLERKTFELISRRTGVRVSILVSWLLDEDAPIVLDKPPEPPAKLPAVREVKPVEFIEKIREVTNSKTNSELAKATGLTPSAVGQLLRNPDQAAMSIRTLRKISDYTGIKAYVLAAWLNQEIIAPGPEERRMAGAIVELHAATEAEMAARGGRYQLYLDAQLRLINAKREIIAIAGEISQTGRPIIDEPPAVKALTPKKKMGKKQKPQTPFSALFQMKA